jgi:hypothetical protein
MRRRRALSMGVVTGCVVGALVAVGGYLVGHRGGRGAACFEVAVHTPDSAGETLSSLVLSRPGAKAEYSFWSTHCTISIGWRGKSGPEGGRWAYFPRQARLYAGDAGAERVFPAAGRWP